MFRLLSFFVTILGFAAVVWFGVTVELGERTLFGHLRAIGGSDEAKQLWDGTRDKVTDLVGKDSIKGAEILKETFSLGDKGERGKPDEKSAGAPNKEKGPAVERAKAPATPPGKPARESASGRQFAQASGKPPADRPASASK